MTAASKSAHRVRKRARGLVRVEVWVPREIRRTVRAFLRRLDKAECMGEVAPSERLANLPKRAYYETHDPPHCPTCECGR